MASSGGCQHVGEGIVRLLSVPGCRLSNEGLCGGEWLDEPEDHEGGRPIGEHGGTNDQILLAALRSLRSKELLGLPVGDLDAEAGCVMLNDVFR